MFRSLAGDEIRVPDSALDAFVADFRGEVVRPGDPDYDASRALWNAMIDRRPALIAKARGAADVAAAVRFAGEHGLLTAVRSGGHNVAGLSSVDDGFVIDTTLMRWARADVAAKRARAGAGALLGDLDRETQAHGLVVPAGIVTHTGVAGLTLGGGLGWLTRKWGLTSDNLVSADVVTADGSIVTASEDQHDDLFWALRGGGGNFGIVTSFEYRCHDFGPIVMAGLIAHPLEKGREFLEFWRDWIETAPEEVTTIVILRLAPSLPFVPEDLRGKPIVALATAYAGPAEEGEEVFAPLKAFGPPVLDVLIPKPFVAHQGMLDAGQPHGGRYYWKSHHIGSLTDELFDVLIDRGGKITSPMGLLALVHLGGAMARMPDTAYPGRKLPFTTNINASWMDPADDDEQMAWTRDTYDALTPHAAGGGFLNFVGDSGEDQARAIYGEEKYARLSEIKAQYDPDNLFRMNHNIRPAG